MPAHKTKILVTGGAGFIGSEFVRRTAGRYSIIVVDKLTYAGDRKRLESVADKIRFYRADICDEKKLAGIFRKERPGKVVHLAAESHVDRSIADPKPFLKTNIRGTQALLNCAIEHRIKKFIHISTDEVYGSIARGKSKETAPLNPTNPYAASKAEADHLVLRAYRNHGLPAVIVRPCNNYGPWQYPEKLIPLAALKALRGEKVPVYGKGVNRREWVYVADCARGILLVLQKGKAGEIYNLSSGFALKNIDLVKMILKLLKKPQDQFQFVPDRPGHDLRYSSDAGKIRTLGWTPGISFADGINETVSWYKSHLAWLTKPERQFFDFPL